MRQLSGLDVSFLNMETHSTFGHVSSLNLYDPANSPDGAGAGLAATKELIVSKLDTLVPFRRRLVEVPFGLDFPYWIDDDDFDIDFHVRHHAVPPPGNPQQLSEVVSRIHARALDRRRPLWELYVIEGVDEGRLIAQVTKVHHAAIDGAAGALILAALLDITPEPRSDLTPVEWTPERRPTDTELLQRTVATFVRRPERLVRHTLHTVREFARSSESSRSLAALADIAVQPIPGPVGSLLRKRLRDPNRRQEDNPPALPLTSAPRTLFNASITPHRRLSYTTLPLESAKEVRRAVGCTFNDVVMALCSGTLRRYLLEHDALPEDSLVAMVPVSIRTGAEEDVFQNRVSAMFADLATNEPDPLRRLARTRAAMDGAKQNFAAIPAEALMDFTQFAPPAVAARAMRMYSRLRIADRAAMPFNLVISNVPGPNVPLYMAGAELKHFYPISALVDGQGLNITVQSYNGSLDFGFIADRELVPDVWRLTDLLHDSMDELLAAI
ncbi:MAG: wax ester/triacylglycerol synthase family O-acyltransferase [Acidimicrobiia bacterium]|nr:wax ester/triacylglycerol synthase family O-acyltransferase [Acidimicrobiia bacterium]